MKAGVFFAFAAFIFSLEAASTISPNTSSNSAWGENIGWINCYADGTNGGVIGDYICSGYIYSGNAGWIHLGNGNPINGIRYSNLSADDFGVNHDGAGTLRGQAYSANVGWITFESTGNPRVDLQTGILSGSIWAANAGWISLSNSFAIVKTDSLFAGSDSDADGVPDMWERSYAGNLTTLGATKDSDGDGMSDAQEYLADTDPLDANSHLCFSLYSVLHSGGMDTDTFTWASRPTRNYRLEYRTNLVVGGWIELETLIPPSKSTMTTHNLSFAGAPSGQRYFRLRALRPLGP